MGYAEGPQVPDPRAPEWQEAVERHLALWRKIISARREAGRSQNVHSVGALLAASDFFERRMVIPGSGAVFLLGLATAWAQGWPIFGFLQGGRVNWPLASILLYLTLLPAIPLYLIPRRAQRNRALREAMDQGTVTPELAAAVSDQGVIYLRTYELVVILAITFLMVIKPF